MKPRAAPTAYNMDLTSFLYVKMQRMTHIMYRFIRDGIEDEMAGYLFSVNEKTSIEDVITKGVFMTLMSSGWRRETESTLGDYATLQAGDNVYFFQKRNVYGIGKVIEIKPTVAVFENRADATTGCPCLVGSEKEMVHRWGIAFQGAPAFFRNPIDMDDLLNSDPHAFRSLRSFWKRSFIKLDDEENQAFKRALLRKNISTVRSGDYSTELEIGREKIDLLKGKDLRSPDIPTASAARRNLNGSSKSEMMLEVSLLSQLKRGDQKTLKAFGNWDYLSHQVPASPMKPVDYMDKIDVFGYSWLRGYEGEVIDGYLVAELKKGEVGQNEVLQVMKYVDWVCREYAGGDYSLIKAFLVGFDIKVEAIRRCKRDFERAYLTQRPPVSHVWNCLQFVEYRIQENGYVEFSSAEI